MMELTHIAMTQRDRFFLQDAEREMIRFERNEIEFRKKDRQERAAELHIPVARTELH
jgi:hypothetical protein